MDWDAGAAESAPHFNVSDLSNVPLSRCCQARPGKHSVIFPPTKVTLAATGELHNEIFILTGCVNGLVFKAFSLFQAVLKSSCKMSVLLKAKLKDENKSTWKKKLHSWLSTQIASFRDAGLP